MGAKNGLRKLRLKEFNRRKVTIVQIPPGTTQNLLLESLNKDTKDGSYYDVKNDSIIKMDGTKIEGDLFQKCVENELLAIKRKNQKECILDLRSAGLGEKKKIIIGKETTPKDILTEERLSGFDLRIEKKGLKGRKILKNDQKIYEHISDNVVLIPVTRADLA